MSNDPDPDVTHALGRLVEAGHLTWSVIKISKWVDEPKWRHQIVSQAGWATLANQIAAEGPISEYKILMSAFPCQLVNSSPASQLMSDV
ncbi:hypothetical protein MJO28_013643 [Puccinia striiformis f. sp. tritici]|uniref:Uncharacterized protein n=1 Tax=Puccinia striiformis f. sp. tritici TaxID=168172 RepID=A0ACC0DVC2_9BASI|nr:hypothetical protein MJO28_013643 [Puccinia striiformis f. sp. tritici]